MGDEVPAEEQPPQAEDAAPEADDGENNKKDEKGGTKKKTWEEKRMSAEKKKKLQYMPYGSDPCIRMRIKGQPPKSELTAVKGSTFPWYESIRKTRDVVKDKEKKEAKEWKKEYKAGEARFKDMVKAHREYLTSLSEKVRLRRLYEANKEPGCTETYEEYMARKEKRKREKECLKRAEEKLKKEEEEEERKFNEQMEGKKDEETKKKQLGNWPGSYPESVTQDFIMMLKLIIEAEYETKQDIKKKVVIKPPSKKDRIIKEFSSFLDVLFTANEMMKKKTGCGNRQNDNKNEEYLSLDTSTVETKVTSPEESEGKPEEEAESEGEEEENTE